MGWANHKIAPRWGTRSGMIITEGATRWREMIQNSKIDQDTGQARGDQIESPSSAVSSVITLESDRPSGSPVPYAFVFHACHDGQACSVFLNIRRMQQLHATPYRIFVLVTPDVSLSFVQALESLNAFVTAKEPPAEVLRAASNHTSPKSIDSTFSAVDTWLKFQAFSLHREDETVKRIIILSPEQHILRSLNDIFKLPSTDLAAPRAYWAGNGTLSPNLILVTLSDRLMLEVEEKLAKSILTSSYDGMSLLNDMFGNRAMVLPGSYATRIEHWEMWDMPPWFRPEEMEEMDEIKRNLGEAVSKKVGNVEWRRKGDVMIMEQAIGVWSNPGNDAAEQKPLHSDAQDNTYFAAAKVSAAAASVAAEAAAKANATDSETPKATHDSVIVLGSPDYQKRDVVGLEPDENAEDSKPKKKVNSDGKLIASITDMADLERVVSTITDDNRVVLSSSLVMFDGTSTEIPHFMDAESDSVTEGAAEATEESSALPVSFESVSHLSGTTIEAHTTSTKTTSSSSFFTSSLAAPSVTQTPPAPFSQDNHPSRDPLHALPRVAHIILFLPDKRSSSRGSSGHDLDSLAGPWKESLGPVWSRSSKQIEELRRDAHPKLSELWQSWWEGSSGKVGEWKGNDWKSCPKEEQVGGVWIVPEVELEEETVVKEEQGNAETVEEEYDSLK
ncbi:glycosyltransferase family 8 protein [Aulographum hederae CBS 113979]|uniref:Glycosyltransferase family 8 protein n=1 Tax=Aulographum hederae CBS 113979 TaxID=1176131 RepID=A0A6G1GJ62_9PEZI|nr:glycosyltransferase family 8 protein [Aulographum hederae CBS 113979]